MNVIQGTITPLMIAAAGRKALFSALRGVLTLLKPSSPAPAETESDRGNPTPQKNQNKSSEPLSQEESGSKASEWNPSPEQNAAIRELFRGGGADGNELGANRLLDQIAKGDVKLPPGVTKELLEKYAIVAQNAINAGVDKRGVQALRLRAIKMLLGNMR